MAAAAIPLVAKLGASAAASYAASRAAGNSAKNSAMKRSSEESNLMAQQALTMGQMRAQGGQLFGAGMPAIGNTLAYYRNLMSGDRGTMGAAVSGEAGAITDAYKGAERRLKAGTVRGGEREMAEADLGRQRAGQLAALTMGVQRDAADRSGQLGMQLLYPSMIGMGGAGNIGQSLLTNSTLNRTNAWNVGQQAGNNVGELLGGFLADYLRGQKSAGGRT